VRASGRYPLTAVGDVNTYALFAELDRGLVNASGGRQRPGGSANPNHYANAHADTHADHYTDQYASRYQHADEHAHRCGDGDTDQHANARAHRHRHLRRDD
jgi:hypothetical protein